MIRWWLILLLLLPTPQSPRDLAVHAEDGRVTILARAVPLKEVLDRLSQETGVKVVYEGPEPSPLITVTIEDQPEREVLPRILEGLGLNHVFQMDTSGSHVEMVIIQEAFGSGPATARSQGGSATGFRRQAPSPRTPEENTLEYEGPDEEFLGPGGLPAFAAGTPYEGPSEAGWPDAEAPGFPTDASSPIPPGSIPDPQFPAAASSPIPPGSVPYPIFPGAASHP